MMKLKIRRKYLKYFSKEEKELIKNIDKADPSTFYKKDERDISFVVKHTISKKEYEDWLFIDCKSFALEHYFTYYNKLPSWIKEEFREPRLTRRSAYTLIRLLYWSTGHADNIVKYRPSAKTPLETFEGVTRICELLKELDQ